MREDEGRFGGWMLWEGGVGVWCVGVWCVRRAPRLRPGHTPRACGAAPCPAAPGIPRSFRSAHSRPLTLKRRGQGGVRPFRVDERGANGVSGVCAGMGWAMVSDGVGVRRAGPASAPGIPRVLASLARAPFAGSERGRTWWRHGPLHRHPGHPPLAALAPPYAEAKGAVWIPAFAGMTGGATARRLRR